MRQQHTNGVDPSLNFEYLKSCVYRYMTTSELSEKKRLAPVIATILKLTAEEKSNIDHVLREEQASVEDIADSITSISNSFFESAASLFTTSTVHK